MNINNVRRRSRMLMISDFRQENLPTKDALMHLRIFAYFVVQTLM